MRQVRVHGSAARTAASAGSTAASTSPEYAVAKVVFSSSLTEAPWANSRIVDGDVAEEVRGLRQQDGGDIIVLASSSVIRALLAADELDRLSVTLCPTVSGGGARLFEDGLPATDWSLTDMATAASGAICVIYDRVRIS